MLLTEFDEEREWKLIAEGFEEIGFEKGIEKGREEGREEGKKEGKLSAFYEMIKNGIITLEQAASTIGVTKDQLLADFKECNLVL
jgi:predicted transposase YdaD